MLTLMINYIFINNLIYMNSYLYIILFITYNFIYLNIIIRIINQDFLNHFQVFILHFKCINSLNCYLCKYFNLYLLNNYLLHIYLYLLNEYHRNSLFCY